MYRLQNQKSQMPEHIEPQGMPQGLSFSYRTRLGGQQLLFFGLFFPSNSGWRGDGGPLRFRRLAKPLLWLGWLWELLKSKNRSIKGFDRQKLATPKLEENHLKVFWCAPKVCLLNSVLAFLARKVPRAK